MKTTMKKILLVCMAVWTVCKAAAQSTTIEVKGMVLDSLTREPIPCATMCITRTPGDEQPVALLACGINGDFTVKLPQAGDYCFSLTSVGLAPLVKTVSVPEGQTTWQMPPLYMAEDTELLVEVTVTAQKPLVKVDIDKVTYSMKDDPDAKVSSTLDMLRKVPMITVDGEDNIQLKGSSQFMIYMNGRPSGLLSENPSEVLKSLPASSIRDIEVITDPGARYDAEGVSGIINIIMEKRTIDGYTANVSAEATEHAYSAGAFVSLKAGKLGITANYNYENEKEPSAEMESFRENFDNASNRYLYQTGEQWEKEYAHQGYLEGSYEIDSLNLITVDANFFRKTQREYSDMDVRMQDADGHTVYAYNRLTENEPVMGSVELNANYQHETRLPGEVMTLSYRFTNDPGDNKNYTTLTGISNYTDNLQWDTNSAKTNEHTFQLDYVRPLFGQHEMETGVKYILRRTNSEITHRLFDEAQGSWYAPEGSYVDFNHTQHIYSVYAGGSFRWGDWGLKAGVRVEGTTLKVDYDNDPQQNFQTNFVDVVPNVTLSYAIGTTQQLRLGYNMRIQRAGIDHLNPYVDESDPLNISYGNPDLVSEKSHALNFNYTLFTQNFNLNASLTHTFVNNSIEQYTFMKPGTNVSVSTFGNIGSRRQTGLFLYLNWTPAPWFRFFMNGGLDYLHLESEENSLVNGGWGGRMFGGAQFTLPGDWRLNLNGGYMLPGIQLQGERSDFLTHGITLNKDFLQKKLTVSLYCQSPFAETWKMENKTYNPSFLLHNIEHKVMREFGISVSYRFGNLDESIKKVKRGIINDDVKEAGE